MYRFLIEDIITKVKADLPEFKTVEIYNNQFDKNELGQIDVIKMPALLIGFPEGTSFQDFGAGVQQTEELVIRFYIAKSITKGRVSNSSTVLDLFDLKQKVYKAFQGYQSEALSTFKRRYEETDEDRTNYYVFLQDWTTKLKDVTKYVDGEGQEVTLTLDIDDQVIINPDTKQDGNGIRTAKNVNDG